LVFGYFLIFLLIHDDLYILNLLLTYNDSGQLLCILCESVVHSEAVWNVHINSKKHRENIASAKRRREDAANFVHPSDLQLVKRPAQNEETPPPKKLKG
jgi:zinc finger protein 830